MENKIERTQDMNKVTTMRLFGCFILLILFQATSAAERVYFTSDRNSKAGKIETQVFSMKTDGSDVRQLTRSRGTKAHAYRCGSSGSIFFQSDDALARLNAKGEEEAYLAVKNVQYHSPRCSSDGRYLSVTAWDKAREKGFVEVYRVASKQRVARWEGEYASWRPGHHAVVYRLLVAQGEGKGEISIFLRNIDKPAAQPERLYQHEVGEYVYDMSEPQFVGPNSRDFVFRVYDEHEYFYYLGELGKSFVLTRNKEPLKHRNVYVHEHGPSLEQGQLTVSPNGKQAVLAEHPWNEPPSLYLVDLPARDSRKIAEGFNPVWSDDSTRIYFNRDPEFHGRFHESKNRGEEFRAVYPERLDGYEIYLYDLRRGQEQRLTTNKVYDGFL